MPYILARQNGNSTNELKNIMHALCNVDTLNNEIAHHRLNKNHQFKFKWDEKKVIDREKGWVARKTKETIHSVKMIRIHQ